MLKNFTELSQELVERGKVLKSEEVVISKIPGFNGKIIISRLRLFHSAKIKYHTHTTDSEFYILLNPEFEVRFCRKGDGHELENTFNEILEVLSIKVVDSN